ncbi:MAG: AAA family ATPase [Kiritimatiellae bacterium]|nr:AAA family ATPase [Kiritimatiellia bacterium]
MTPAERYAVGSLLTEGAAALRLCEAEGLAEDTFADALAVAVWRCAKKLDGEAREWDGVALADRVSREVPGGVAQFADAMGEAVSLAFLPCRVREIAEAAWRRDTSREAAALAGQLRHGGDGAEAWEKLVALYTGNARLARVHWMTGGEVLDAPDEPNAFFVHPWLAPGTLAALVGAGGTGKTRFYLWALAAMFAGRPMVGTMPIASRASGGKWLVVAGNENGLARLKADLSRLAGAMPDAAAGIRERLVFHVVRDGDAPMDADALPWVEAKLRELGDACEGVVFDPVSDLLPAGESLNEDASMKALCVRLRGLVKRAAPKAAVLLVHHARGGREAILKAVDAFESGETGRNSKMLAATCRCVLNLVPYDGEGGVVGAIGKCNDAKRPEPFALRFVGGEYQRDPDFSLDKWKEEIRSGGREDAKAGSAYGRELDGLLVEGELVAPGTLQKRAEAAGMSRTVYFRRLKEALEGGRILREAGGYRLAEGAE